MKTLIISIFLLFTFSSFAQNIDLIRYEPQNPQPGDTLTIYCYLTYGVPCCSGVKERNIYLGGNAIFAESFFCLDTILTHSAVLYPETDTFYFVTNSQLITTYPFYYMPGYHDEAPCYYPHFNDGSPYPHPYIIGHIDIPVGTTNTENVADTENQLQVHPNPATDQVIIDWQGENYQDLTVEVYDMTGKQIRQLRFDYGNVLRVNTSDWQNGLYLIRVSDGKKTYTEKIIVQH
jgi:hypothetical protein